MGATRSALAMFRAEQDVPNEKSGRRKSGDVETLEYEVLAAYDRLADGANTTAGLNGKPVHKVPVDKLKDEVITRGFLQVEIIDDGKPTSTARSHFHRAKVGLAGSQHAHRKRRHGLGGEAQQVGGPVALRAL